MKMPYINIHDGTTHTLDPPTLLAMPQTLILIGKETERGWEQAEDIGTLLPSLKRYETEAQRIDSYESLKKMSLNV